MIINAGLPAEDDLVLDFVRNEVVVWQKDGEVRTEGELEWIYGCHDGCHYWGLGAKGFTRYLAIVTRDPWAEYWVVGWVTRKAEPNWTTLPAGLSTSQAKFNAIKMLIDEGWSNVWKERNLQPVPQGGRLPVRTLHLVHATG